MRFIDLRDLLRRSGCDHFATVVARFRPKIDNPIGGLNHFEIMFDHDDRVTAIDEALKKLQQHRDVVEMQSSRRFVENKKIAAFSVRSIRLRPSEMSN